MATTMAELRETGPRASFLIMWFDRFRSSYLLHRLGKALFPIWLVSSITFFVMLAMIVSAFLSIREGRRRKERWRDLKGESSILYR